MDISIFHQPHICGSGMWYILHTMGVIAVTPAMKAAFDSNVNAICDSFRCLTCKPHFRLFIDTHDIKKYFSMYDAHGRDIGCFYWTWLLHNAVNARLGKYQPTFEEAYAFYSNFGSATCSTCAREGGHSSTESPAPTLQHTTLSTSDPNYIPPGFGLATKAARPPPVAEVAPPVPVAPSIHHTPIVVPTSTPVKVPHVKPISIGSERSSNSINRITPISRPAIRPTKGGYRRT